MCHRSQLDRPSGTSSRLAPDVRVELRAPRARVLAALLVVVWVALLAQRVRVRAAGLGIFPVVVAAGVAAVVSPAAVGAVVR